MTGRQVIRATVVAVVLSLVFASCGSTPPTPSQAPASPSGTPAETASQSPSPYPSPTETPLPTPAPPAGFAALDGVPADPATGLRLPVAVMVDDNASARPQYGFNEASIVYQAPADGGEDRYMLVFQELDAPRVEPIRSGRPYFVNWASEYRAAFAHYGGDAKTLALLPSLNKVVLYNVDALAGSYSAFHRDGNRYAPHNAYTSTDAVRQMAMSHGAPASMPSGVAVRPFAADLPEASRPAAGWINVPYNTGTTAYTYDAPANAYLRSVTGKPQFDAGDGQRVTARNVVVLFMGLSIDPESEPGYARPVIAQVGSGDALVFRDGKVIPGTWRKDNASGLTRFYDRSGAEITLVRGRIFIQVVPTGTNVTFDAAS